MVRRNGVHFVGGAVLTTDESALDVQGMFLFLSGFDIDGVGNLRYFEDFGVGGLVQNKLVALVPIVALI